MQAYRIADLLVRMDVGGRTYEQAAPYAVDTDDPADLIIQIDPAKMLERNPRLSTEELSEYMYTGARFAKRLLDFQGFMLHSSAVVLDGKAYLFSAPSGTGKSTHTEKWIRLFGAEYLNDDKPALRLIDGTWMAYGTPWSGKYDLSRPIGVPLAGIAVLQRGDINSIERMDPAEAFPYLMGQISRLLPAQQMDRLLSLMDDLLRRVPVWDLRCRNEDEAAYISHRAMTAQSGR